MKYLIIALLGLSLVSCKKSFSCYCYQSDGNPAQQYVDWEANSKKRAKDFCNERNASYEKMGGHCDVTLGKTRLATPEEILGLDH